MGHHHIPPQLPPVLLPTVKLEKSRWRPRVRAGKLNDDSIGGSDAAGEGEEVYAPAASGAAAGAPAQAAQTGAPAARPGGVTAQALTEGTLRTLLVGQEGLVDGEGALDRST